MTVGPSPSSARGGALANDEGHRIARHCGLLSSTDGSEEATTGIAPHLTHRLCHRRQARPRPCTFWNAVERGHGEIVGNVDASLLRRPDEADGEGVTAEHHRRWTCSPPQECLRVLGTVFGV